MRFITVNPSNLTRVGLMLESVLKAELNGTPEHKAKAAYYMGVFSDKVNQCGLDEQEDCAFSVMTTIVQSNENGETKAAYFLALVEFAYLLGWVEAESVFQMALNEQQERAA